ncbi:MAG: dTDP-4-dehydrorhamnose 3,5-epimerase [Magnetococcales bacterium]|nr:dTDP-4-dehydrorhamnose 3,5-epimerase [Magnetococcales bacterium]
MRFIATALPEVLMMEPTVLVDHRGAFMEVFHRDRFTAAGLPDWFVQDNQSQSVAGVLRGLHFQEPHAQGKLVRVLFGAILDVAVDIRRGSPRFGQWVALELSAANRRQLWIPPGFAHGFCVLSPQGAEMVYKQTEIYHPEADRGIRWNDPRLAIPWPIAAPILSDKDRQLPLLEEAPVLPVYGASGH